jgi:hypothetical protein
VSQPLQPALEPVAEIPVDPDAARVYEHGWQSWSTTTTYGLGERPLRPGSYEVRVVHFRPEVDAPADAFWGEGLLAVDPGGGAPVHVFGAPDPGAAVPSIRARAVDGRRWCGAPGTAIDRLCSQGCDVGRHISDHSCLERCRCPAGGGSGPRCGSHQPTGVVDDGRSSRRVTSKPQSSSASSGSLDATTPEHAST